MKDVYASWPNTKRTALHVAARNGDTACILKLVHIGANIEQIDKDAKTALALAAWKHNCQSIKELVRMGADTQALSKILMKNIESCLKGTV